MADDSTSVGQTPVRSPPPPQPPAGHPAAAPPGAVGPGGAGQNPPPQPAAHEPKLRVPGPDPIAAEKQAEAASLALKKAKENEARLISEHATPARMNAAAASVHIALGKAKVAVRHNLYLQGEDLTQRQLILDLAESERTRLDGDYPTPAKLDDAFDRLGRALNDWTDSDARLARAAELAAAVASVAPAVKAATATYPGLGEAEDAFNTALYRLEQDGLGQLEGAAVALRDAWAAARTDASNGSVIELQKACDAGFAIAEGIVRGVNDPAFVKAHRSR
jgi:hypothetical protein